MLRGHNTNISSTYLVYIIGRREACSKALVSNVSIYMLATTRDNVEPIAAPSICSKNLSWNWK